MATTREILTFQLGNYVNYVCTHWWNIQESYFVYDEKAPSEINHDVMFREGKTFKGLPTFTPRTIVVDKKENAMHISLMDESAGTSRKNSTPSWDPSRISAEMSSLPGKHEYIQDLEKIDRGQRVSRKDYNFEDTTRTWCDFMKTRYHPKSLSLVNNDFQTDIFHSGTDIFRQMEDDLTEKVRSYMEECNNLQGFQVLVDSCDAYGGAAHQVITHLRDEYQTKTIFALPVTPSYYPSSGPIEDVHKMINILLTYQKLSENCDLVVPISTNQTAWLGLGDPIAFPHLNYDSKILYQSSAILSAYMDSVSLKYRLRSDGSTLHDLISGLNFWERKICAASISLPFPMLPDAYLMDTLEHYDESDPLWNCLTPGCTIGKEKMFYQRITIRGVPDTRLRNPKTKRKRSHVDSCTSVSELFHLYLSFHSGTISNVTAAKTPLKTEVPFPQIFSYHVSRFGSVDGDITRSNTSEVESCPVLAGLHSCKDIGRMLESLHSNVKGINIKRFHQYLGMGMDLDEYEECLEKVHILGNEYVTDMEL